MKFIDFAHPTSVFAAKFGFARTGCYLFYYVEYGHEIMIEEGFPTIKDAESFGDIYFAGEWHPKSIRSQNLILCA